MCADFLLFSIPEYFPPKVDLDKFGYSLEGETLNFDLTSSLCKEKIPNFRTPEMTKPVFITSINFLTILEISNSF